MKRDRKETSSPNPHIWLEKNHNGLVMVSKAAKPNQHSGRSGSGDLELRRSHSLIQTVGSEGGLKSSRLPLLLPGEQQAKGISDKKQAEKLWVVNY